MFAGRFDHALDEKGRTMMPRRFRERLAVTEDRSVWMSLALDGRNHLEVRPGSAFRVFQEKLSQLPQTSKVKLIKRFTIGMAMEVDVDNAGRLLIPASLRKDLDLSDRIVFVGADENYFEIWKPETLDTSLDAAAADPGDLVDYLAELKL
jgi:MraZ protein